MSVYRDKKEWNKWNEMVLASEHAKEDFNDFADDRAVIQADKKIQSLLSKNYTLERQLEEVQKENTQLKEMREHLKWKDETRKEKERLERQLEEAMEEIQDLKNIGNMFKCFVPANIADLYNEQLKEQG